MIIENFLEAKQFLPAITIKSDITSIDDMLNTAESELVEDIIGENLEIKLSSKDEEDKGLLKMCQRIIAINGFLNAVPEMDLVLTQSGFAVHSTEGLAPASTARVNALIKSLITRSETATDQLIKYLMRSEKYKDLWRNTIQFEKISSGLISTYSEFKEYAQYSPTTADQYPKGYSEFKRMYTNLNLALMGEVSTYLSREYCEELIEKYRDSEIITLDEKHVLRLVRFAICAISMGDLISGRMHIIRAREYMKRFPISFPTFTASPESQTIDNSDNSGPIFSML